VGELCETQIKVLIRSGEFTENYTKTNPNYVMCQELLNLEKNFFMSGDADQVLSLTQDLNYKLPHPEIPDPDIVKIHQGRGKLEERLRMRLPEPGGNLNLVDLIEDDDTI